MRVRRAGILSLLFTATLFVSWFFLLRPNFLGGPVSYVIVAGTSMEPTLHGGDLVIVKKQSAYETGDIVAFRAEGGIVIHRIIAGNADGYVMKGDNKSLTDAWQPNQANIVGEKWLHIPSAGHLMSALKTPIALSAIIGLLATMSILGGTKVRQRRRRRAAALRAAYAEILDQSLMLGRAQRTEPRLVEAPVASPRQTRRIGGRMWVRLATYALAGLSLVACVFSAGAIYYLTHPSMQLLIPLVPAALATMALIGAFVIRRRRRRRETVVRSAIAELSDYKDSAREQLEGVHSQPVAPASASRAQTARVRSHIRLRLRVFIALCALVGVAGAIYLFSGSPILALTPTVAVAGLFAIGRFYQVRMPKAKPERPPAVQNSRSGLSKLLRQRRRAPTVGASQIAAGPLVSLDRHPRSGGSLQPSPWILGSLAVFAIVTAAAAALAAAAFLQPAAKTSFVERLRYEHGIDLDPSVIVAPAALYPEGVVRPIQAPPGEAGPTIVYTRLIRSLQLDFAYSLGTANPSNISGEIGADVEIGFKDGWRKRLEPLPPSAFSGTSGSARLSIDVPAILTLLDSIEKEIDFKAPVYELVVSPFVRASGSIGQETIDDTFITSYVIKFNRTQLVIEPDLARTETKAPGSTINQPREIGLFGESIPVKSARLVALVGLPIGLALVALLGSVAFLGLGRSEAAKIQSRYGLMIVSVTNLDSGLEEARVRVAAFQDLIRIADRAQTVILHQALLGNRHRYLVKSDLITYEFELAESNLSEATERIHVAA